MRYIWYCVVNVIISSLIYCFISHLMKLYWLLSWLTLNDVYWSAVVLYIIRHFTDHPYECLGIIRLLARYL
jgi:hypothetical protein